MTAQFLPFAVLLLLAQSAWLVTRAALGARPAVRTTGFVLGAAGALMWAVSLLGFIGADLLNTAECAAPHLGAQRIAAVLTIAGGILALGANAGTAVLIRRQRRGAAAAIAAHWAAAVTSACSLVVLGAARSC